MQKVKNLNKYGKNQGNIPTQNFLKRTAKDPLANTIYLQLENRQDWLNMDNFDEEANSKEDILMTMKSDFKEIFDEDGEERLLSTRKRIS